MKFTLPMVAYLRLRGWKFAFVTLFLLSLLPRLLALERYVTPDELVWVYRTVQFREALLTGQWQDTLTAGHPGVMTTWLGTLGISAQMILAPTFRDTYEWITHVAYLTPDNMAAFSHLAKFLTAARLPVAAANSLGVFLLFLLTKSLYGRPAAWLAALLLALDPFFAGLSGLLHVDGLMTSFATVSLLALGASARSKRQYGLLALSGASAAMAVLTKSPALLLPLLSEFVIIYSIVTNRDASGRGKLWDITLWSAVWAGVFSLMILLLFPALWTSLGEVIQRISGDAGRHLGSALRPTFFLGRVDYDHGFTFYPVNLAFRLGPVVTAGLLVAGFQAIDYWRRRSLPSPATLALLLWSLLYPLGISLAAKKFDRYILPVIPALSILAAIAWIGLSASRSDHIRKGGIVLLAIQLGYLAVTIPYPLTAYNPLFGGSLMAEKVMTIGWGEGISAAGKWLSMKPEAANKTVMSSNAPAMTPFFSGRTVLLSGDNQASSDYVVLSNNDRQLNPEGFAELVSGARLIHTIRFGGLDQAWIYAQLEAGQNRSPITTFADPISFDHRMQLLGSGVEPSLNGERLYYYARWSALQGNGNFTVQLTLSDEDGSVWGRMETLLLNEDYFRPVDWSPGEKPEVRYALDLAPAIPPGIYRIELSLFDNEDTGQLPVLTSDGQFRGIMYRHEVELTPSPGQWDANSLNVPVIRDATWEGAQLRLLGSSAVPAEMMAGTRLPLDLFWAAGQSLPAALGLSFELDGNLIGTFPLSRYDTGRWLPGTVIHEKYRLLLPPELKGGRRMLQMQVVDDSNVPLTGPFVELGVIDIEVTDRLFSRPQGIPIELNYPFAETIKLIGLEIGEIPAGPGEELSFTLVWQAEADQALMYNAFVHVLGPDGRIAAQADQWPGGQPTNSWLAGQVILDQYSIRLPAEAPAGSYQVVTGLYRLADGLRLPVVDSAGSALPERRVVLPIEWSIASPGQ